MVSKIMHDTLESISAQTLEDIGHAAVNAIKDILKEKGYNDIGGVYGGKEYHSYFKRDAMDIMGYEKPIVLSILLPYAPEEDRERRLRPIIYSTIPKMEHNYDDYLEIDYD